MPLGIKQNNNLLYLTLDVWQDLVFLNEQAYPARMSPPCWMCCGHTRPSASWTSLENWRCWTNIAARTWWMP